MYITCICICRLSSSSFIEESLCKNSSLYFQCFMLNSVKLAKVLTKLMRDLSFWDSIVDHLLHIILYHVVPTSLLPVCINLDIVVSCCHRDRSIAPWCRVNRFHLSSVLTQQACWHNLKCERCWMSEQIEVKTKKRCSNGCGSWWGS